MRRLTNACSVVPNSRQTCSVVASPVLERVSIAVAVISVPWSEVGAWLLRLTTDPAEGRSRTVKEDEFFWEESASGC
ncbi:hypothetical protein GCM10023215_46960 [Pseudonocardia yuanmonensis]|uniref:Uncharacterized protein n=1 Tax=Pseudonocardia yuanmonensis TaxID=1095914 RepID=A0ABP8X9N3_9PSEU